MLGLALPKRLESSAVRRNVIKRVWREAIRKRRDSFTSKPGKILIVRLVKRITEEEQRPSLDSLKRICRADAEILLETLSTRISGDGVSRFPAAIQE